MKKRTFITSFGIMFIENVSRNFIKYSSIKNFTIHDWIMIGDQKQSILEKLKFKIVRWLYKDLFDKQLKRKGIRTGLTIIRRKVKK